MEVSLFRLSKKSHGKFSLADIILYGGPRLSPQNQKPHDKTKNLTAKTTYLTTTPETSRQNYQSPHGKTKYFRAKTKYLTAKANTQAKPKLFCFCCEVFGFAVRFLVLPWGILFLPWGFWFCRDVFVFAVRFLVLPWGILFLSWGILFLPWQLWATIILSISIFLKSFSRVQTKLLARIRLLPGESGKFLNGKKHCNL